MRLTINDRMRACRRAALAPLNRIYCRIKRSFQSFVVKAIALHGSQYFAKEGAAVNSELLLSLFRASQRPLPAPAPALQAVPIGNGRLLALHPLVGFMYVGTHDVTLMPQIVLATYQERQTAALEFEVRRGDRVLHLGAGQGFHSLSLAHLVGPQGEVVAISSSSADSELLLLNIEAHGLGDILSVCSSLANALECMEPTLVYVTEGFRLPAEGLSELASLLQCNPGIRVMIGSCEIGIDELSRSSLDRPLSQDSSRRAA